MAMHLRGSETGGGRRGGRRGRQAAFMSEINITPMVDVMLVLLIIFMVAAPLLSVGVPIDLPETAAKPLQENEEPITISIQDDGRIYIQETETPIEELVAKLSAIAAEGYEERIYVRGDRNADYGTIMRVMGEINAAGYRRLGLVTEEEAGR